MIRTKEDLRYYLAEDAKQAGEPVNPSLKQRLISLITHNYNRDFMICLRKLEYHCNNSGIYHRLMALWYWRRHAELRAKTGNDININVAAPGLHLVHGKVVINSFSKIGCNCKINSDVVVGWAGKYTDDCVPVIGNRVYIGAGAKIIGHVTIADDVVIGANTVVTRDITEPNTTWVGNPARKVKDEGSYHFLNRIE
jgi:serine O-acetyltransferase